MQKQFDIEPDDERVIFYSPDRGEYGIVERKDPTSYVAIAFCPWCGKDVLSERFKALLRR